MGVLITAITPLQTARLLLRPLALSDAERIQEIFPRWEIVRHLASVVPWPYPADGALTYIRDIALPAMARGDEWHWTLRLKGNPDLVIGSIGLKVHETDNRGFWLALEWHRQGLMTEAADAVTDYWFDVLKMPVLRVPKAIANVESRRISEKQGMRVVATAERDYVSGRLPAEIWEVTADEWRARRQGSGTYPLATAVRLSHMKPTDTARTAWQQFVEGFEPLRPELYRYCRFLTRSAWDAEDLVQDTLARGLVTLGCLFQEIDNPRAWMFRVASNLWIDRQRRAREELRPDIESAAAPSDRLSLEGQDAAVTLIGRLSPQERAAVVLKDVFDFTLEETAAILTTTPGAIKAALHRGRGKLADPDIAPSPVATTVIDAFCDAFNAHDLDRLVALLLNTATAEVVGIATEYGPAKMKQPDTGSLYHSLFSPISHAVAAKWLPGYRGGLARAEKKLYRGELILVSWYDHDEGPAVRDVIRIAEDDGAVASVRFYFFCPDVIAEVTGELELPWRSNGYRYW